MSVSGLVARLVIITGVVIILIPVVKVAMAIFAWSIPVLVGVVVVFVGYKWLTKTL